MNVIYKLKSSDGIEFEISSKALHQSKTLSDMIDFLELSAGQTETMEALPVSNVKSDTMNRIVEWCEKHHNDEFPTDDYKSIPRSAEIPAWDVQWLEPMDNEELYDLICGADYLNIPVLMDYSCKMVANMAMNKSPEQMRQMFGLLTDEEEEKLANRQIP